MVEVWGESECQGELGRLVHLMEGQRDRQTRKTAESRGKKEITYPVSQFLTTGESTNIVLLCSFKVSRR